MEDDLIKSQLEESAQIKLDLAVTTVESIQKAAQIIIESLKDGNRILLCGNGGSAADSQHIAAELVGRFLLDRKAIPAVALTTDTSILTAVGNDFGFDTIFQRQIEALGRAGDVLIGLSTSGQSKNVIIAMKKAKSLGLKCIALAGEQECPMDKVADVTIHIPSRKTPRIQEAHITIGHIICDLVESQLFNK
jgi:D-sedoheptulose 7-phosphate isomerase